MKLILAICVMILPMYTIAQSKDQKDVETAVEALRKAMVDADVPLLTKLTAASLSYGHSSGLVEDKNAFLEKLKSGQSDFVSIVLSDQTVDVQNKTAIVRHILSADTNDNGKAGKVQIKVLLVWIKQKNDWVLLARQAVRMN